MAYAFWKEGRGEQEAVFNLFFRNNPFKGGYTISCGLQQVIDYLQAFSFKDEDLNYLATLRADGAQPLFEEEFLSYLSKLTFDCDLDAITEGRVVFPHEPVIRVKGPIIQGQLIESPLLNIINFQSLIATKAARINQAAKGQSILEFGLRRAQGIDGAISASRAAYIGGCSATSNVLAGKLLGIPVAGTHAHSWVMSFANEKESFESYARALPHNCVFLVDTYDTVQGIKYAIEVGKQLIKQDKRLLGVRIDSGDLAYFSQVARSMLDAAGFTETKIVASNDLDEHIMSSLRDQDAAIDTWGVGTKLVTAFDQPSLGGVYKLSALKENDKWSYKLKLSEQSIKVNNPGIQQVRRFYQNKRMIADMIYDQNQSLGDPHVLVDPMDPTRRKVVSGTNDFEDLLVPIFRRGKIVYQEADLETIRSLVQKEMDQLDRGVKRFVNPHSYVVGLQESLFELKTALILKLRKLK